MMVLTDDFAINPDMGRFNTVVTDPPIIKDDKLPPPSAPENSIAGILALGMLGVAIVLIVFGLWAQKHRRKPMLMQCRTEVKSYHSICNMPATLQLPQFMSQMRKEVKMAPTSNLSYTKVPLVHSAVKNIPNLHNHNKRNHKIITVSDMWKEKSLRSNNFFIINVIPEEAGD